MQIEFVFQRQNSFDNQAILEANKDRLSNQCRILLNALLRGERLTTSSALLNYGIGDARARVRDLIKSGIQVSKELQADRFKVYYMTSDAIKKHQSGYEVKGSL